MKNLSTLCNLRQQNHIILKSIMHQIQNIKLNNDTCCIHHEKEDVIISNKEIIKKTRSIANSSLKSKNCNKQMSYRSLSCQDVSKRDKNFNISKRKISLRKISLTHALLADKILDKNFYWLQSQNHLLKCPKIGTAKSMLNEELENWERRNIAASVVKMYFINNNYKTKSNSECTWCESELSLESNLYDRRYYETIQWKANLLAYQRSQPAKELNKRAKLKYRQLKPLIITKPLHLESIIFKKQ